MLNMVDRPESTGSAATEELPLPEPVLGLIPRAKAHLGRLLGRNANWRFSGAYDTYAQAIDAARPGQFAGFDNSAMAQNQYPNMSRIMMWDYPILYWLRRLLPGTNCIIDAGGHVGTKYEAFRDYLDLNSTFRWVIFDLPSIVEKGRAYAAYRDLGSVSFTASPEELPDSEILLASGLFQYFEGMPSEFIARLPTKPKHLLLNKVATRTSQTVFTVEQLEGADVPYMIRNRAKFETDLKTAGYVIRDSWEIAELSLLHPDFGRSVSVGYYAELA